MRFEYADRRMPVAMTKGGARYYLAFDQVGTLRVVTDSTGAAVKRIDYDSFGNVVGDTNPAFAVPFGFAGGLHDRDTGLVRFGYRDYDPETGRWTAKDPILFAGGDVDLYGYCLNDPVNLIDPDGESAMEGAVPIAIVVSQMDTAIPGPANLFAGAIIAAAWMYDNFPAPGSLEINSSPCFQSKKGKGQPDSIGRIERDKSGGRGDRHVHGKNDEWAINEDGTMHDGNKGKVPKDAADYLKKKGFKIPKDRYPLPNK